MDVCCVQELVCGDKVTYFAGAFDWKASRAGSLDVDIYENDLSLLERGAIGAFKRIQKPIDRVVNSFLEQWLGTPCQSQAF